MPRVLSRRTVSFCKSCRHQYDESIKGLDSVLHEIHKVAPRDLPKMHEMIRAAGKRLLPAYCSNCAAKEGAAEVCLSCDYNMERKLEVCHLALHCYEACARTTQPPLPPPQKQRTSCGGRDSWQRNVKQRVIA